MDPTHIFKDSASSLEMVDSALVHVTAPQVNSLASLLNDLEFPLLPSSPCQWKKGKSPITRMLESAAECSVYTFALFDSFLDGVRACGDIGITEIVDVEFERSAD